MQAYEIRIQKQKQASSLVIAAWHPNDVAAIRCAMLLAEGRAMEVWRDLECVHRQAISPQQHAA